MWASVQNSIVSAGDDPVGAANAGLDRVLGPSYDYLQQIQSPAAKGVSSNGTIDQVFTNTGAIAGYVNNLILGPKLGNQMFTDTGGMCKAPNGSVVHRWSWINNKLGSDDAAAIMGRSFKNAVGGSQIDGIVSGMGGDIAALNPLKIMNAMVLDGIPPCQAYSCPVTLANGIDNGRETHFVTPSLELNMNGCKKIEDSSNLEKTTLTMETAAKQTRNSESFTPYFVGSYGPNVLVNTDPTPLITLGVAVALFLGYIAMRIR